MATILVVDDMPIFREPIAAALRGAGYQTVTANDGKDALVKILEKVPQLIILDLSMPVVDGITFLTAVRNHPTLRVLPVILLTEVADKEKIVKVAKLGVQDYVLKSRFSLQDLLARIQKYVGAEEDRVATVAMSAAPAPALGATEVATPPGKPPQPAVARTAPSPKATTASPAAPPPSQWPVLLTREQTMERLDNVADSKTMAGVVAQVVALASSPRADLTDIVNLINKDPILASRILQLANSSAYASSKPRIGTVEEAARNIGVLGIQNMALSIGIFGAFPPDELDGFNTMRCWQHSFAVADLINVLPVGKNQADHGINHLVGLCHDLGDVLLRQHFAEVYGQILSFAARHNLPAHVVEGTALGVRHPELVSRLLSRIGLPQPIVHGIREFHERQVKGQEGGMSLLARSLGFANQLAHGLLLASSPHESVGPILRTEWKLMAGDKPLPPVDPDAKRSEILAATNILARLPASEERRLMAPLLGPCAVKICYVRPTHFVDLDPLAYALNSLAREVTIVPKIPAPEELRGFDAMVAVGLRPGAAPTIPAELLRMSEAIGKTFPILALIASGDAPVDGPSLTFRQSSVELDYLHRWLSSISKSAA
jgi:two-component system chemotaxis response regulator CheY